uniref:7 kDa protein n=1 Tax=Yam virus 1 TaxID=3123105 RepID=A0AAU6NEE7_9CLOS
MEITIVFFLNKYGVNLYYCSKNRDYLGDFEVKVLSDFDELISLFKAYPFIKREWLGCITA